MDPRVLEEMLPYFIEKFGNAASRSHVYGWEAQEAVDLTKGQIMQLIGAKSGEIVFTSGATEAINLALKGVESTMGKHIITCQTEHKAVLDTCAFLETQGYHITYLPVDSNGIVSLSELETAFRPDTVMIAIMYANNETGVIQPIEEIGKLAKANDTLFFCDATQAAGKIPIQTEASHIDLLCLSGHKFYGPKGIGALYIRRKTPAINITEQIHGGKHQRALRSGTLNIPGIVGLGKAAELCFLEMDQESDRLQTLRDIFERALLELENVHINGNAENRLPQCLNITFDDIDGEKLILQASSRVAFSQSSACTSATLEPSYVLKAMGLSDEAIHNSFRFSFGRFSTEQHAIEAAQCVAKLVTEHRIEKGIYQPSVL